jgi:putative nucleotidyltransferase with HDIG domain
MRDKVNKLWPEIEWIQNGELREKVTQVWIDALEQSLLDPEDLERIPFTLLAESCPVSFMEHKRSVVHIAKHAAEDMMQFYGDRLPIDMDTLIAGAILIDVGKLLEYEVKDGKAVVSRTGRYLRHPFTGVALAHRCGVPDEICHMIATHAKEGHLVRRSVESIITHHADFLSFEPFLDHL